MTLVSLGTTDAAHRAALWIAVLIGFSIPISTALDNVLLVALLLCWLASGRYQEKLASVRSNPVIVLSIGFFLLHLIGATYSVAEPPDILRALDKASVILLIPLLVSLSPGEQVRARSLFAFLSAIALTLVLSLLIWLGVVPEGGVIKGLQGDPSVFKMHITHGLLVAFGAFALVLLARDAARRHVRPVLWLGAFFAAFNVLFMVHGRTGQLVLLVLIAYYVCSQYRWRGVIAAVAAGGILGVATYFSPTSALHERIKTTIMEIQDWQSGKPVTARNMRLESWANSAAILRAQPFLGVGTGGFATAYAQEVRGSSMLAVGQPENQYLLTSVQLGTVGLAGLLALFFVQWRVAARTTSRTERDLARGLVLLMAVGCMFNSFLLDHTEALFYAWFSGLLLSGQRYRIGRASTGKDGNCHPRS